MFNFLKFLVKPHTPFEAGTILIPTLQRKKIQFPLGVYTIPPRTCVDGGSGDSNPGLLTPETMLSGVCYTASCWWEVLGVPGFFCCHLQHRYYNFYLPIHPLHRLQAPGVFLSICSPISDTSELLDKCLLSEIKNKLIGKECQSI